MKHLFFAIILLITASRARAGGPVLDGGLRIQFMSDAYHLHGGFVTVDPSPGHPCKTFHTAKELFTHIQAQPKTAILNIRRNGIWIYMTELELYSRSAKAEFNSLLALCNAKKLEVHLGVTTWRPALPNLRQKP
jgi:hypothetical protein